jgi:sugar phosphate permease
VLIRIVLWWSTFTALTGCVPVANGFVLLLLVRFLFGAGEAGALPNAARVVSIWFPPGKRGPPQALISFSAQIGAAGAPFLTAYFIKSPEIGWRWAFVIFGSLGLVWIWFFARWFRDDPVTHPGVNEAERRYILGGRKTAVVQASEHHRIPWRLVLTNANIWLLGLAGWCTGFYAYMLFSWFPTYLKEGRGLSESESGFLGIFPYVFGAVGVLLGGYLGDWLTTWTGSRRLALAGMGSVGLLLAGALVGGSVLVDDPTAAVLCCSIGYFFSYITLAGWWAAIADIGGRHLGVLFGLCNMISLTGGGVSQWFLGWFADYMQGLGYSGRAQWDPAFYLYGGVLMFGGLLWMLVNPTRTVVPDDAAH